MNRHPSTPADLGSLQETEIYVRVQVVRAWRGYRLPGHCVTTHYVMPTSPGPDKPTLDNALDTVEPEYSFKAVNG